MEVNKYSLIPKVGEVIISGIQTFIVEQLLFFLIFFSVGMEIRVFNAFSL